MSTFEKTNSAVSLAEVNMPQESLLSKFLGFVCSVRLGIVLLILLCVASFIGMLIMQQNVTGFEQYFAELPPAKRSIYGELGLFNIYNSWYFKALLSALSINIILASIDRFPQTWQFVKNPKTLVSEKWLRGLNPSYEFTISSEKNKFLLDISESFKSNGFNKIRFGEKNGQTIVFAESGVWNRFGAYAVHVGLLTIFAGGFLTSQFGSSGQIQLGPGQKADEVSGLAFDLDQMQQVNKPLGFEVLCKDIEQKLLRNEGSIDSSNTFDWLTTVQFKDGSGVRDAVIQINKPYDYKGYRFFHSSFVPIGRARNITIRATDETGNVRDLSIKRDSETTLENGTKIKFADFRGNFAAGKESSASDSNSYPNPAAILQISPTEGPPQTAYAFPNQSKFAPVSDKNVGGYKFQLLSFEKVSEQHILSVQRDPGSGVVYFGFALLFSSLVAVFFFSHQRVWAIIIESPKDHLRIVIGGSTNRNQPAFEEKFKRIVENIKN